MVQQVNGFKLDKTHTFAVNMFDDVSRYMQIPDEYETPEDKEFETPVSACRHLLPGRCLVHDACISCTLSCMSPWKDADSSAVLCGSRTLDARQTEPSWVRRSLCTLHCLHLGAWRLKWMLCCLQENLWQWMMDPRGRDQFVIRYQDATEICWNDAQRTQAEEVYKRSFWTESFVGWSPHGSYLATMHRQGVALWGGPSFSRLVRFTHPNVCSNPSHASSRGCKLICCMQSDFADPLLCN